MNRSTPGLPVHHQHLELTSNSCPSSQWCHPAISSSVDPFSTCPQSLRASGSFPMGQLFASGGQSIGVSALTSVLSMNAQDWSPLGWIRIGFKINILTYNFHKYFLVLPQAGTLRYLDLTCLHYSKVEIKDCLRSLTFPFLVKSLNDYGQNKH